MDSGSAVPTLNPGWSETVAVKLLTVASARWEARGDGAGVDSARATVCAGGFMVERRARFLALESAGSSKAATTAMIATTTSSSMRVNARRTGNLISHLGVGCYPRASIEVAKPDLCGKCKRSAGGGE